MNERELLSKYLPAESVNMVTKLIVENNVHLKITKQRKTKLGDYRPPVNHSNHRISINHNLNPFAFLITFVHEMAHLIVWERFQNKVSPHGIEWKSEYRNLMNTLLEKSIFPDDISTVLSKSIVNSKASSSSDLKLSRMLKKYDKHNPVTHLEDLLTNTIFKIENGNKFKKGIKKRTRYLCLNLQNKKQYLFHPLTPVEELNN
ncbi:MAG: sprT domain-containing protein [Bacteroidetes bacterium]|nr:sprT domain-containing protein [Bacteroidota bacterium]